MAVLIESKGPERQHRPKFQALLQQTSGPVRIASAYVTDKELLGSLKGRDIRLITNLSKMDIVAGATSLDSLKALIEAGVQCRCMPSHEPRLHAKVYLFGDQSAVVTSCNLTNNALQNNIEVGIHLSDKDVLPLIDWFTELWDSGIELTSEKVSGWQRETEADRIEYKALKKKLKKLPLSSPNSTTHAFYLSNPETQFFVCNTNKRQSPEVEGEMRKRGYAAAWLNFNHKNHMKKVKQGDIIFMFKVRVGIIAIGRAKAPYQQLEPGNPDRIRDSDTAEWRVPAEWLVWKKDSEAFHWKSENYTFLNVSGEKEEFKLLREGVIEHLLLS